MKCPPAVADALLDILRHGLLRARAAGWSGDAERCPAEADHLHNLPALLQDFAPERLQYYWDAERPAFMSQLSSEELPSWEPLWQRLRSQADTLRNAPRSA